MTELVKFDPSRLMDAVRDRIKAEFVGMIPDAEWTKLIDTEVTAFFATRPAPRYDNQTTSFREVVHAELRAEVQARMKAYFQGPEWAQRWKEDGSPLISKNTEEMVVKLMPDIQKAIFGDYAEAMIRQFMSRLSNV